VKRRSWPAASIGLLALGCASAGGGGEESFDSLRAREIDLPAPTEIAAPDDSFRALAAGALDGEIEAVENGWRGIFEIGTEGPIACVFYHESMDVATTLDHAGQVFFAELAKVTEVKERRILGIDAGNVGPAPVLAVDWITVTEGGAIQLKLKMATKGDRSIYCHHAETGYAATFDAFFRGLVDSYSGGTLVDAVFRDISLASIGETRVGYQFSEMTLDDEGDVYVFAQAAYLFPAAADALAASDDVLVEWSEPDGTLINAVTIESDGSDVTQLSLEPTETGWHVTGEMQGKAIDETFEPSEPLLSALGEFGVMNRLADERPGAETLYQRWIGSMNPTDATPHTARALGDAAVEVSAASLVFVARIDDRGVSSWKFSMGRVEIEIDRVWVEGSPFLP